MSVSTRTDSSDIQALDLNAWLGKEVRSRDRMSAQKMEAWRAILDFEGLEVGEQPLGMHWGLATDLPVNRELSQDGHARKGGFLPPMPLPRRMWAGGEVQFLDVIHEDDEVERQSTIKDIQRKSGKSGELWFVTVSHSWRTPRGAAIIERQDIVFREPAIPKASAHSTVGTPDDGKAHRGHHNLEITCVPPTLFRFSALTFNSHRIHYDLPYATKDEGYTGLVVHGPLQASLLANYARQIRAGSTPAVFRFRGVAPLVLGQPFTLNADEADAGLTLWVTDAFGKVTMRAEAEW